MKGRHKERKAGRPGLSLKNQAQSFRTDTPLGALELALDVSAALGVWTDPTRSPSVTRGGLGRSSSEARASRWTITNAGQAQRTALAMGVAGAVGMGDESRNSPSCFCPKDSQPHLPPCLSRTSSLLKPADAFTVSIGVGILYRQMHRSNLSLRPPQKQRWGGKQSFLSVLS